MSTATELDLDEEVETDEPIDAAIRALFSNIKPPGWPERWKQLAETGIGKRPADTGT